MAVFLIQGPGTPGPAAELFGTPTRISSTWDETRTDAVVGLFSSLVIGVRSDITVETSRDAVLTDDGKIIVSCFEQDVTAFSADARFACAIGKPMSPSGEGFIEPFASAKWTKRRSVHVRCTLSAWGHAKRAKTPP